MLAAFGISGQWRERLRLFDTTVALLERERLQILVLHALLGCVLTNIYAHLYSDKKECIANEYDCIYLRWIFLCVELLGNKLSNQRSKYLQEHLNREHDGSATSWIQMPDVR